MCPLWTTLLKSAVGLILNSQSHLWTNGIFYLYIIQNEYLWVLIFLAKQRNIFKITTNNSVFSGHSYLFLEFCHNCTHCWEMAEGSVGVLMWSPVNLSLAKQPWGCHYPRGHHPFKSPRFHLFPLHLFDAEIIWEAMYGFFSLEYRLTSPCAIWNRLLSLSFSQLGVIPYCS